LSSSATFRQGIYQSAFARKIARWLEALPHPALALEISTDRVAGARWTRTGGLDSFAIETLPNGALVPSAVETNIVDQSAVKGAVAGVMSRLRAKDEEIALLVPDPVIRVFVQHFDQFPRSPQEAEPMLRWKLKKSVPFEADETVISYMRQAPREDGVDVVTALARLRIVREYEGLAEGIGLYPGVILSSSLAAITLLDDHRPTLLARVSGPALTTAIVREGVLCGYRCTELPAQNIELTPQMLLE
jgi:type IV pilus assembly protein PilM